jgi:hypothetical protein
MKLLILKFSPTISFQIFSSTPCSQTPSSCSFLNTRDQVSDPYKLQTKL